MDEKQTNAVRMFCQKNFSQHGKKRAATGGLYDHDWADLVNQIHYFDHGKALKDVELLKVVARQIRREFPNGAHWNENVNAPGAHTIILAMIRDGLTAELNRPALPDSTKAPDRE